MSKMNGVLGHDVALRLYWAGDNLQVNEMNFDMSCSILQNQRVELHSNIIAVLRLSAHNTYKMQLKVLVI